MCCRPGCRSACPLALASAFSSGVQVLTSRLLGIGQEAGSGRIFRRGLWWAIVMGGVLTAALVPFAAPFFHFVFVTIAPASPEAAAAAVTPEHVAASTAAVTRIRLTA